MFEVDSKFNFFTEANFEKSDFNPMDYPVGDDRRYEKMIFEGLASDSSIDSEDESMNPNGFVIDRFLKHGLINLDHLPSRSPINKSRFWIGHPLDAYVKNNKFYVRCQLWKKSPEARAFYDKALEMLASGTDRKPGFSVEGRALERDKNNPKKVTKALITNVAMTMTPVNANSFADIVKGVQTVDFVEDNKEEINNGSNNVLLELQKDGYNIKIDKSFNVTINPIIVERDERFQELYNYYLNGNVGLNVIKDYLRTVNK